MRFHRVTLCELPEDMLRSIAEFCDLTMRCAVTCTNSALVSLFLGSIRLRKDASFSFLNDAPFRKRILGRLNLPLTHIHLTIELPNFSESEMQILSLVRSVKLLDRSDTLGRKWLNRVRQITNLKVIYFSNERLAAVSALASFTHLIHLDLGFTEVSDLSPLAGLSNLTYLDLHSTKVTSVASLAGLFKLTYLNLNRTHISDVSALARLTNLTRLHLLGTKVSDVSALADLTNLTDLNLNRTQVSDVSALVRLVRLNRLYLTGTNTSGSFLLNHLKSLRISA